MRTMTKLNLTATRFAITLIGAVLMATAAFAETTLKEGTEVKLIFDQLVSSKTAKAGDRVKLHVGESVLVDGKTVIPAGIEAHAVISHVGKKGVYGKNASLQLTISPLGVDGTSVELQPRQKGKAYKGSKTDKAAIATGAGAVLLGPVGLVGGVFVRGKEVKIKPGDPLMTQVSRTVVFK